MIILKEGFEHQQIFDLQTVPTGSLPRASTGGLHQVGGEG
jgi:hypothetical protein